MLEKSDAPSKDASKGGTSPDEGSQQVSMPSGPYYTQTSFNPAYTLEASNVAASPYIEEQRPRPDTQTRAEQNSQLDRLSGLVKESIETSPDKKIGPATLGLWSGGYGAIVPGSEISSAEDIVALLRDQGQALIDLYERPVRIGITTFSGKQSDYESMKVFVDSMLEELQRQGIPASDIAIVSGLTNMGGVKASYEAAYEHPDVELQGIAAGPAIEFPTASVDKVLLIGKEWRAESEIFEQVSRFVVGMGGGAQAKDELLRAISKKGSDHTFLVEGYLERKGDALIPGAVDSLDPSSGGVRVPNAQANPEEQGRLLGRLIAERVREERKSTQDSPLLNLAVGESPSSLVEVKGWAEANAGRYRVIRILNALKKKLENDGAGVDETNHVVAEAAANIISGIRGVDNLNQNREWQTAVKAAIEKACGSERAAIAKSLDVDVMFGSWFGIQTVPNRPVYFETHSSPFPAQEIPDFVGQDHTFDIKAYGEIRLDYATRAFLKASFPDDPTLAARTKPAEIFLGSTQEMEMFYRSQELEMVNKISDSNGTNYYLFANQRTGEQQVVMHGIDSESRMVQLGSLLRSQDVPVERIVVRGELSRLRESNRNLLELTLAHYEQPIAGVIVGNKNESTQEIIKSFKAAGVDVVRHPPETVGPFRFERLEIPGQNGEKSKVILAFAPAYGEASYDLTRAAFNAGVRNFMVAGAGGSLMEGDRAGIIHKVVRSEFKGKVVDLREKQAMGIEMIDVPGAPEAVNITSPTPFEQTKHWAINARARAGNVDQEMFHILEAIVDGQAQEISRSGDTAQRVFVQTGLCQSDVVGSNGLAMGTVDPMYPVNIANLTNAFITKLGLLPGQKPADAIPSVNPDAPAELKRTLGDALPVDDLSTIWDNQFGQGIATQLKGEKRVLEIDSSGQFSPKGAEMRFLKDLLGRLDPQQHWIAVKQSDPNHDYIINMAAERGFETILVATDPKNIHGDPTFVLKAGDEASVQAIFDELIRDESENEYEKNLAAHYRLHLGHYEQPSDDPHCLYQEKAKIPGKVAEAINKESHQRRDRMLEDLVRGATEVNGSDVPLNFTHEVEILDLASVEEFLAGRRPVLFSGASKGQWPKVSEENKELVERAIEEALEKLDPAKDVIVTGGTDFGVEALVHKHAARMGFQILATLPESTKLTEVNKDVSAVVMTGINWYGMSRPVLQEIVKRFDGIMISQAGGGILKAHIELAGRLGIEMYLQKGPEGAATELAERYAACAFREPSELAERLARDR